MEQDVCSAVPERFAPLLARIGELPEGAILAIDGCCASGKSTLGQRLSQAYGCPLFHMDDFFLRPEQRFGGLEELRAQISRDVAVAQKEGPALVKELEKAPLL